MSPLRTPARRLAAALVAALAAFAALTAASPAPARASSRQIAIIQDQNLLQQSPETTLAQMQALGATTVRVFIDWSAIAPDPLSTRRPRFAATNPDAYPAANWTFFDVLDRLARARGMTIDLVLTGGEPRWAEGPGAPHNWIYTKRNPVGQYFGWKPDADEFGQFVHAVGTRYDGHFTPKGQTSALPRIHFWSLWNEPNFGQDLGPQAIDFSRYSYAPGIYRGLVRTSWAALRQTGHSRDTILIGELAAHGYALSLGHHGPSFPQGLPGNGAQTQPLPFLRTLYCLDSDYHSLTGSTATNAGCPTTSSGRHAFRRDNPGLFDATGVGVHPYANHGTPASDGKGNSEWATLPNFGRLETTLDRANRAWGSGKRYPIYNDEYGYITSPPTPRSQGVSPETAARYINWAEYLTWRQPRVASYEQYLVEDGGINRSTGGAGFASGLIFSNGKPKPGLDAYRLPLWLPSDTLRRPGADKVWGEARPATWTGPATHRTQSVRIQFRARHGAWRTIATVHANHYFVARPRFTTSGDVRLSYTYPSATADPLLPIGVAGSTIVSRTQSVVVR